MHYLSTYLNGLGVCSGLIMAIGSQNAHVLRTGIKREHVGLTVATCIAIDVFLISLGVAGMGSLIQSSPVLMGVARWGGAAFLLWYGLRSWRAVFRSGALAVAPGGPPVTAGRAVLNVMALSLLNPHVYLDVVLISALGSAFEPALRPAFTLGAASASLIWFCALGYGATRLSGLFSRPVAWKWIDALTGTTMLTLSVMIATSK